MRRMLVVAFLSVLLVGFSPVFAQHAGHSSGGFGGHVGGGFSSGPSRSSFGSGSFGRSFASGSFASTPRFTSTAPVRSITPFGGLSARQPDNRYRYRSPYRGSGFYGSPYVNSWEVLPWDLGYPDFTGYGDDSADAEQQPEVPYVAAPDDGYRPEYGEPGYGQPEYQDAPSMVSTTDTAEPQLTLIFNDGHRETIRNYALTRDTVIVMDRAAAGYQQKIPLSALNLPATEQAAQQAGLDFTPPA
jgi:hypothetical protein